MCSAVKKNGNIIVEIKGKWHFLCINSLAVMEVFHIVPTFLEANSKIKANATYENYPSHRLRCCQPH
jgi:hypothetical protein